MRGLGRQIAGALQSGFCALPVASIDVHKAERKEDIGVIGILSRHVLVEAIGLCQATHFEVERSQILTSERGPRMTGSETLNATQSDGRTLGSLLGFGETDGGFLPVWTKAEGFLQPGDSVFWLFFTEINTPERIAGGCRFRIFVR